MAGKGPPRLPEAVRARRGTLQACRTNPDAPEVDGGLPSPPDWLPEDAAREWRRAGKILLATGLMTLIDKHMFATYCNAVARQAAAQRHINAHGLMLEGEDGLPVINPAQKVVAEAAATVHRLAREFGMSASARATVKAGKSKTDREADARRKKFAVLGAGKAAAQ